MKTGRLGKADALWLAGAASRQDTGWPDMCRGDGAIVQAKEYTGARRILGLTEAEAAVRRTRRQNNIAAAESSRSYRLILLQNSVRLINLTLFAICVGLAVLSLFGDAAMTGGLVLANVVVGVVQEVRAKRKIERMSLLTRPTAMVIREGIERSVDRDGVVVDDVLVFGPGDQILVDGRILSANGLTSTNPFSLGNRISFPSMWAKPSIPGRCWRTAGRMVSKLRDRWHSSAAGPLHEDDSEGRRPMRLVLCGIAILSLLLIAVLACGGDEEPSPTASPSGSVSGSETPPFSTPTATSELTLTIDSIEPSTVRPGATVIVTFVTRPGAVIGLQVLDGKGNLVTQDMLTAGSNGNAPFDFVAEGAVGQWMISAAAGATQADLLRLQASPVPGPNTVDRVIEVQ